ncbi:hypothetical protein ON010_g1383 [Phytophthora cinnamomi]|nr:hypothetical protein ON010_g1383 [Phytophthora cinnamomi]
MPAVPMAMTAQKLGVVAPVESGMTMPMSLCRSPHDHTPGDGGRSHPDVIPSIQVLRHPGVPAARKIIDVVGPVVDLHSNIIPLGLVAYIRQFREHTSRLERHVQGAGSGRPGGEVPGLRPGETERQTGR